MEIKGYTETVSEINRPFLGINLVVKKEVHTRYMLDLNGVKVTVSNMNRLLSKIKNGTLAYNDIISQTFIDYLVDNEIMTKKSLAGKNFNAFSEAIGNLE